jgi:glycosyltransferase involved in cell wall biosynthesis
MAAPAVGLMRLLHVYSGNLYGGIETLLVTMARARALCPSIEPELALCFEGRLSAELEATGAPGHHLPEVRASRPLTIRRARRALAAVLEARRFDRVVCHAAWSQGLFGGVVKRSRTPLVFWAHDLATGAHWTERLARRIHPDLVICNSRYTASSLRLLYDDVQTIVLAYPVDTTAVVLREAERAALRQEFNTPSDATVLIQVSRLEAWKGHAAVLEALAELRELPGWIWWVVGGAQRSEEKAYVEGLVAAARRLGIEQRVRWLGERQDVRRLLAAADVHCQINAAPEPFGIAFIEALAAGRPVVASRSGGAVEIVDDSCGVLVSPGDAKELAAALERLIRDPAVRARLGAGAQARAHRLCDPATQMRRLADALAAMSPAGAAV